MKTESCRKDNTPSITIVKFKGIVDGKITDFIDWQ